MPSLLQCKFLVTDELGAKVRAKLRLGAKNWFHWQRKFLQTVKSARWLRNRRATATLSPVLIHFLALGGKLYLKLQQVLNAVKTSPNEPLPLITSSFELSV
jgi:hypothetical protein